MVLARGVWLYSFRIRLPIATMSLRLAFVSNLFPDRAAPYFGLDNATVLHWLAREHGWDIRVICPRPSLSLNRHLKPGGGWTAREGDEQFKPEFVPVPYVPKLGSIANRPLMAAALRSRLKKLKAEFAFDVILASWLFPDGCAVAQLAAEVKSPCALITQGSDTHQYLAMPARRRQILHAIEQAQGVIARSGDLARRLGSAGAETSKLHTIYNGVDPLVFHPRDQAEARRALGLDPTARVLLFVGNFLPVKNPALLIRAFAQYREAAGDASSVLLMAGKGPMQGEMRDLATSLGIADHVRQTGPLNSGQIAQHMAAADLLCLSSVNEGLPNVILEAMACGLPVLSTRVGGIAEVVDESRGLLTEEGNLASYAKAMQQMLAQPRDRSSIASYGSHFTWARAASEYDALLRQVTAKPVA